MMKKLYFLSVLLLALIGMQLQAQTILFSEDFAGGTIPATWTNTGTGGTWSAYTQATLGGLTIGTTTAANGYAIFNADTLGNDGLAENVDLITNSFSCAGQSTVYLAFEDIFAQYSIGQGVVTISTDGGTTWSAAVYTVGPGIAQNSFNANPNVVNLDISAIAGNQADVRVKFNYTGNWDYWWIVDDIFVYAPAAYDAAMLSGSISEFTSIPLDQVTPLTPSCEVFNNGSSPVTNVSVATTITNSTNAVVYSSTMTQASLAVGATAALTAATTFTPTAVDFYLVEYVVSITELDNQPLNDTLYTAIDVADSLYARDFAVLAGNAAVTGALGIGAGNFGVLGNVINITSPTEMVSLEGFLNGSLSIGDTITAKVYNFSGTTVGSQIYTQQKITAGPDSVYVNFSINPPLPLAVGQYFIALEESFSTNFGVLYSDEIYQTDMSQASVGGGAFGDLEALGFRVVPLIRANTYTAPVVNCSITALAAGAVTACNSVNNEYTQEVIVTSSNPPLTGTLDVNGQSFPVSGTSPQTVLLTGLDSDGAPVNVTASFSDDAACTYTENALFTAPASCLCPTITVSVNTTDVNNCATPDGTATAAVVGGTAPYTYAWTPNVGASAALSSLPAGTYDVVVTDANGCAGNGSGTIVNVSGFSASVTSTTNVSCFGGNDGSITVTPSGGTAPFSYVWTGSTSTSGTASSLIAGSYDVLVTDANSCTVNITNVLITEPTQIANTGTSLSNVSCNGLSNGTINIVYAGGTSPLTYTLDGASAQSIGLFDNLAAGTYTVRATDANGCFEESDHTISEPALLVLSTSSTAENGASAGDGTASVAGAGGITPYTYLWDDANAQTTATATALNTGTYNVTVMDANGCSESASVFVDLTSAIKDIALSNFTVYPNPATKNVTVTFGVASNTDLTVNFYNTIGNKLFSDEATVSSTYKKNFDLSNLSPGIYFVEIQSEAGKAIKKLTITK